MNVTFSRGTLSLRFQGVLLVMIMGLLAAVGWFTYSSVHAANSNSEQLINAYTATTPTRAVTTYNQCVAAGGKQLQTYPESCVTSSGQHFTKQ